MSREGRKALKLDKAVLGFWIDEFEREMFPHQESEFEQETFTDGNYILDSLVYLR